MINKFRLSIFLWTVLFQFSFLHSASDAVVSADLSSTDFDHEKVSGCLSCLRCCCPCFFRKRKPVDPAALRVGLVDVSVEDAGGESVHSFDTGENFNPQSVFAHEECTDSVGSGNPNSPGMALEEVGSEEKFSGSLLTGAAVPSPRSARPSPAAIRAGDNLMSHLGNFKESFFACYCSSEGMAINLLAEENSSFFANGAINSAVEFMRERCGGVWDSICGSSSESVVEHEEGVACSIRKRVCLEDDSILTLVIKMSGEITLE